MKDADKAHFLAVFEHAGKRLLCKRVHAPSERGGIDLPIEAFHWLHGRNGSCFPHTLIIAEERAKVTFVDYYESSDAEAPGLACRGRRSAHSFR